jgi:hypothetical protein
VEDTSNYRGISLISHVGKLFTSVLNTRRMNGCKENSILTDAQFGFIPGYGTQDAIFALRKTTIFVFNKFIYNPCCFEHLLTVLIIFCNSVILSLKRTVSSADINRYKFNILWQKLLKCGISGNLLILIKSMYSKLKNMC